MDCTDLTSDLTADRLRSVLRYEPESGKFFWLKGNNQKKAGDEAGFLTKFGYVTIYTCRRHFMAHRLAWLWMTGEWPKARVDHKNMVRSDNRWNNLREADDSDNKANQKAYRNNFLGVKGVRLHESGKYVARVCKNGKSSYLGVFDTIEEARSAYEAAAKKLHGEFARVA